MKKAFLIAGVLIIAGSLFYLMSPAKDGGIGGAKLGQITLLDRATTTTAASTYAAKQAYVGDYSDCVITTYIENYATLKANDYYTFKIKGAATDDQPTLTSVATSTLLHAGAGDVATKNIWTYIRATSLIDNNTVTSAGTTTLSNPVFNAFQLDNKNIKWVGVEITAASTTASASSTPTFNAVINCQK